MTFTFDSSLGDEVSLVRFHTGDTNESGAYLTDETIEALLVLEGSVGGAVIACIKYIISQLSTPNFRKSWLSVDLDGARNEYKNKLKEKAQEFGVNDGSGIATSSTISLPYRADSYQYTTSRDTDDVYNGRP
jgi:hypothetical protein